MKVAFYIRVSTVDQNAELQRRELQHYTARHGWDVVMQYEDTASGADPNRPELSRLMAAARRGMFECVLVWKLDRFGRSLLDCLSNLELLENEQVRFIAISQGLDTDRANPAGRFLLHILGAAAEFERALIRERSTAGMNRYRADLEAGRVGRTVHSRSGKNLPPHRPRRILDVEKINTLRAQGLSWRQVASACGVPAATVLRRFREACSKR